jgi:hypothetical protein
MVLVVPNRALGDVAVGLPLGREPGHPALAGGQRFHAGAADASRACPGRRQLVGGLPAERCGAQADGEVEPLAQRLAGLGAVVGRPRAAPSSTRARACSSLACVPARTSAA